MSAQTNGKFRRLGVLTGGGDVPGLNAAIKALVYRASHIAMEFVGLRAGWEGITFLDRSKKTSELLFDPDNDQTWDGGYLMPLTRFNTRDIDRMGGTILQSTRTNPANMKVSALPLHLSAYGQNLSPDDRVDLTVEVLANLDFLGLDGLVVIGGDDTLSYGSKLSKMGVAVWGIPKTMDNDVPGTDYCIGFQTAIGRASEFINRMRSTAGSHRETVLFRMFGRDAGFTALETAIVTWSDRVLIPEVPCPVDRLADLVAADRHNPSSYSIVLMSEGANIEGVPVPEYGPVDAYGHRAKTNVAEFVASQLSSRMPNVRFLPVDLTYILRSGEPDVYDKHMAIFYANLVMSLVEEGKHGVMAAWRDGQVAYTELPGKDIPARRVDTGDYNQNRLRPNFEEVQGTYRPQTRKT